MWGSYSMLVILPSVHICDILKGYSIQDHNLKIGRGGMKYMLKFVTTICLLPSSFTCFRAIWRPLPPNFYSKRCQSILSIAIAFVSCMSVFLYEHLPFVSIKKAAKIYKSVVNIAWREYYRKLCLVLPKGIHIWA